MKRDLLDLIYSPCCKATLKLETKKILINNDIENKYEDIMEGILCCLNCNKEYPIINGIPRLCNELWEEEKRVLEKFKKRINTITEQRQKEIGIQDVYSEIEKIIRQKINIPLGASDYLKKKLESDIYYRIEGCEKQEKYIHTLELYYDKKKVRAILDIGGGQGGLIKCFLKYYTPSLSIMLDYDLSWVEVAKLRNPAVQIIRGDATNLPFQKESIDIVISQAMLEHVKQYDKALKEMCEVTKHICFICWNPNKFFLYDFGHLDAPVTIFPKEIAKYIAILWHKIRKTGCPVDSIVSELEKTFYISTSHVKNFLKKYGYAYNVFTDFALFSIKSDYSYRMKRIKKYFLKHIFIAKLICNLLVLFKIEPQCYYILKKDMGS